MARVARCFRDQRRPEEPALPGWGLDRHPRSILVLQWLAATDDLGARFERCPNDGWPLVHGVTARVDRYLVALQGDHVRRHVWNDMTEKAGIDIAEGAFRRFDRQPAARLLADDLHGLSTAEAVG